MTNSKWRFGLPLAIVLATASAAAVADGSGDSQIKTTLQASLDQHPDLGAPGSITVRTRAGVVYLYGEVSTGLERENAESLAEKTPGVARVVDSIFVSH
jgi:osmotically-inducible protein OsmY